MDDQLRVILSRLFAISFTIFVVHGVPVDTEMGSLVDKRKRLPIGVLFPEARVDPYCGCCGI